MTNAHPAQDVPQFIQTSHGVRAHLPILDLPQTSVGAPTLSLALLACHMPVWESSSLVALILRCEQQEVPMYTVGATLHRAHARIPIRWVTFTLADAGKASVAPYTWRDIYIAGSGSFTGTGTSLPATIRTYPSGTHHVFIPFWTVAKLGRQGFVPQPTLSFPVGTELYHTAQEVSPERSLTYAFRSHHSDITAVIHIYIALDEPTSRAPLRLTAGFLPGSPADPTVQWLWEDLYDGVRGAQLVHNRETGVHVTLTHMARESSFVDDIFLWAILDVEFDESRLRDWSNPVRQLSRVGPLAGDSDAASQADSDATDVSALDTHSKYAESDGEEPRKPGTLAGKRRASLGEQDRSPRLQSGTRRFMTLPRSPLRPDEPVRRAPRGPRMMDTKPSCITQTVWPTLLQPLLLRANSVIQPASSRDSHDRSPPVEPVRRVPRGPRIMDTKVASSDGRTRQ